MSISTSQYVDLLVKKLDGVAKTDTAANKSPSNESIASPMLNRGDTLWSESNIIPATAATTAGIVEAYTGTAAVETTADTTTVPIGGIYPTWLTGLTNWIPPEFGSTYFVQAWVNSTGVSDPTVGGTQIFDSGTGGTGEWYFDYQAGLLNFIGQTIPASLTGSKVIYIIGYRYVGKVGVQNLGNISIGNVTALGSLESTGNLTTTANISASYFLGNGAFLTGISGGTPNTIANGTSNVTIATANANVDINVGEAVSTFDATGNLVLSNNFVIGAPGGLAQINSPNSLTLNAKNNNPVVVQGIDNNNNPLSVLTLDPNNTLTRLQGWSGRDSNSWTSADWATGVYTNQGGGTIGAIEFTGAPAMIAYIDSINNADYVYVQVNGGPLLASQGWGGNTNNITFYVAELPATDPTTVTDFAFYFYVSSIVEMDYDSGTFDINSNGLDLTISTRDNSDIDILSVRNLSLTGNGFVSLTNDSSTNGVDIITNSSSVPQTWNYGNTGILTLPGEGVVRSNNDTIILQSYDTGTSTGRGVRVGTDGGLYFEIGANPSYFQVQNVSDNAGLTALNNVLIVSDGSNTTQTWNFTTAGSLVLSTVNSESVQLQGSRKIVGGALTGAIAPYSATLAAGGNATVAYTSTVGTVSSKITFAIQSNGAGFQWEQFDVVATPSGDTAGTVNYVVSNRVKSISSIPDTVVTATINGSNQMEISLTLDAVQTSGGWASFDAVEFGLMVD